ncbi:SsgA family sporulation/cell division regulator [Amycolatopsis sp. EV170708-02-1]|uniref:SsgA family sporulation/cell division regulator n=1 Tax=Amycolatopsis sp. EV170708-02-1 TaxID=2919322 RepID=UPI001F0C6E00|nr:SsgA family sporulation/cell division regulator [Amycolatopsis sp. EV170708-02-1]UMP07028.1 SsgA family sporulation/cell division regulator [Amycolatopsis sp. EV170708-02-1]
MSNFPPDLPVTNTTRTVSRSETFILGDWAGAPRVEGSLHYRESDPYAITMLIGMGDSPVEWKFARDLLAEGLIEPAGEGDVRIVPPQDGRDEVTVLLSSPDGRVTLLCPPERLATFLRETVDIVSIGDESGYLAIDGALGALLDGESR